MIYRFMETLARAHNINDDQSRVKMPTILVKGVLARHKLFELYESVQISAPYQPLFFSPLVQQSTYLKNNLGFTHIYNEMVLLL